MANRDEPAIRILDADAGRRPRRGGGLALLLAGAVGIALGIVAGGALSGTDGPMGPTSTTEAGAPDLAAPGPPPEETTTTTTTRPRARPVATIPPVLRDLVPGLATGLRVALYPERDEAGPGRPEAWHWRARATAPDIDVLPPATYSAAWDAGGAWGAALGEFLGDEAAGGVLYVGRGTDLIPAAAGVTGFRWHATVPGRIAWVEVVPDGPDLLRAADLEAGVNAPAIPLPMGESARLEAWGEWGYTLALDRSGDDGPEILVLGPDGAQVARRADALVVAVGPAGETVVAAPGADLVLAGPALDEPVEVGWEVTGPAFWSPSGCCLAAVTDTPMGAALQVHQRSGPSFRVLTSSDRALMLGWSPDDRFVVMWLADSRELLRSGESRPALVFADLQDKSLAAVPVDGIPLSVAFPP